MEMLVCGPCKAVSYLLEAHAACQSPYCCFMVRVDGSMLQHHSNARDASIKHSLMITVVHAVVTMSSVKDSRRSKQQALQAPCRCRDVSMSQLLAWQVMTNQLQCPALHTAHATDLQLFSQCLQVWLPAHTHRLASGTTVHLTTWRVLPAKCTQRLGTINEKVQCQLDNVGPVDAAPCILVSACKCFHYTMHRRKHHARSSSCQKCYIRLLVAVCRSLAVVLSIAAVAWACLMPQWQYDLLIHLHHALVQVLRGLDLKVKDVGARLGNEPREQQISTDMLHLLPPTNCSCGKTLDR